MVAQGEHYYSAQCVNAVDTTAAGGIFIGGLAVALTEGKSLAEAIALGQRARCAHPARRTTVDSLAARVGVAAGLTELRAAAVMGAFMLFLRPPKSRRF